MNKALPKVKLTGLYKYATRKDIKIVFTGIFTSILNGITKPLMVLVLSKAFGEVLNHPNNIKTIGFKKANKMFDENIKQLCLDFVYLSIVAFILSYIQIVSWLYSAELCSLKIRNLYFQSVCRKDLAWFDKQQQGKLTQQLTKQVNLYQAGIGEDLGSIVQNLSTFICSMVIGISHGWKLSFLMLLFLPLMFGSIIIGKKYLQPIPNEATGIAEEVIEGIKTIKLYNGIDRELIRFYNSSIDKLNSNNHNCMILSIALGLITFFLYLSFSLSFLYGSHLVLKSGYNVTDILSTFTTIVIGTTNLMSCLSLLKTIIMAQMVAVNLFAVIESETVIDSLSDQGYKLENFMGDISFRNVSFAYPSRPDIIILKDFSLDIEAGKTIALVGGSGSGKSTIIKLIERFYDCNSGSIIIDGVEIQQINTKFIRSKIGLVDQDPFLFDTSIFQNIAWGLNDDSASMDMVIRAAKLANAHDFIMKLPYGYDTTVGGNGGQLSGGQKQRISIARAIIKDPKILLLDEATSALDSTSERIVQSALDNAKQNRTTIIVAHRLSTIKNADVICVLDHGVIVEKGTHRELLDLKGAYTKLVSSQNREQSRIYSERRSVYNKHLSNKIELKKQRMQSMIAINENKPNPFFKVLRIALKTPVLFAIASIGVFIDGSISPLFAYMFTKVLTSLAVHKVGYTDENVMFWATMIFVLALFAFIGMVSRVGLLEVVGNQISTTLSSDTFSSILRQDITFFDKNSARILSAKLSIESDEAKKLITDTLKMIIGTTSTVSITFLFSFYRGWKLSLLLLLCIPLVGFAFSLKNLISAKYTVRIKEGYEQSAKSSSETINNIKTIMGLCREETMIDEYEKANLMPHTQSIYSSFYGGIGFALSQSFSYLFNATAYYYGSRLVLHSKYNVYDMVQVLLSMMFLGIALGNQFSYLASYSKAKVSAQEIFDLIEKTPRPLENHEKSREFCGNIEFENIQFSYPTRKDMPILNNFSINLPAYKNIALVGSSGSGKSTIFSLIQRFYEPEFGNIKIEGVYIEKWDIEGLRDLSAIVEQEPILFNYSIMENIKYSRPQASFVDVVQAAKQANAHDFIMELPEGYNTIIGIKGSRLSGGQKQRIAIARALIRKPKLLLLDEATSALDNVSEKIILDSLKYKNFNCTTITIAHRLSTVVEADVIFVMENGKLMEQGDHKTLMNKKKYYYQLYKEQNLQF